MVVLVHSSIIEQAARACLLVTHRCTCLKLAPKLIAEGTHRVAEVRVEAVAELHDASRDLVEVDLLLPPIALDHKHFAHVGMLQLVASLHPVPRTPQPSSWRCTAAILADCASRYAVVQVMEVPGKQTCLLLTFDGLNGPSQTLLPPAQKFPATSTFQ